MHCAGSLFPARGSIPPRAGNDSSNGVPRSAHLTPQETAEAAVESNTATASAAPTHALVGGFRAGAYIAFGNLVAIDASAGLPPER